MSDVALVEVTNGVADVRLNRPHVMNAFNDDMFEVPVIAAIHGAAVGAGLQLALGADLRYATPTAKFAVGEINWGLIPDMGGTQLLPPLIGLDHARDLIYSGRTITGAVAAQLGLVTALFEDPLSAARDWARMVASRNPHAIRDAKALTALTQPVSAEGLLAERKAMRQTMGSENQIEAVRANLEGRGPRFTQ